MNSAAQHKCGTCRFWSDQKVRVVYFTNVGLIEAQCLNHTSPRLGRYGTATNSCAKHDTGSPVDEPKDEKPEPNQEPKSEPNRGLKRHDNLPIVPSPMAQRKFIFPPAFRF